ncbi:MAG: DUF2812 domain-containing protein [Aminipila sp.]
MKKFRLYLDKDEEEKWLNEMSMEGWAFKKFFLGWYTFEASEPGEYYYQIDLLNNWDGNKKDFSCFMEESGVEVISQWYRWVFIRKKSSDGPFEMYTDGESKIAQYTRIKNFFFVGFLIELICLLIEINCAIQANTNTFWGFVLFLGMLVLVFLKMVWKCKWKIQQLKSEI